MTGRERASVLALIAVLVAACAGSDASPAASSARNAVDLEVYAAASLKGVLADLSAAYGRAAPGASLTISVDASSALAAKIEQGAPADVFLAADMTNPRRLVDGGLANGDVVPFAANTLTVVVPTDDRAGIASPADLARPGVRVIAAGDEVPITKYATQLVANLAGQAGYPADFEARYTANIVSREDNVAAVLAKIALGEGDAGIVYVTDARSSDKVTTVDVPDGANVPATYGGVVVAASDDLADAAAFLAWLTGSEAGAILASFGFQAVD